MTPEEQAAADLAAATTAAADKAAADKAAADKAAADKAAAAGTPPGSDGDKSKGAKGAKDDEKPGAKGEAPPEEKAPEKYELKLAEGSKLGKADLALIERVARENDLSNESAQKLVESQEVLTTEQSTTFLEELKADKTYGGEKLAETQRLANALLDKVRPKDGPRGNGLRDMLARGYGNNLEVASLLADLGRMTLEDSVVNGSASGTNEPQTMAELLYGKDPKYASLGESS